MLSGVAWMGINKSRVALGADLIHAPHLIDTDTRSKETKRLSSIIQHVSCRVRTGIQFS